MDNPVISDLKAYARILQRRVRERNAEALSRLRVLREFARASDEELLASVQRRHCLGAVALQLGFRSWPHALEVLERGASEDLGTLLYPSSCSGHWNIWSAAYAEASAIREAHGGYLLGYRRQFLIVDRDYIDSMGLDPDDGAWDSMGRDWIKPRDPGARMRLYGQLVRKTLVSQALVAL